MGITTDRFSRLAALKPAPGFPGRLADLREPDETDPLSVVLGAGIARNHYGEHLAIRNWFSTPEFAEPSSSALKLLAKTPASLRGSGQAEGGRYKSKDAAQANAHQTQLLNDPTKWLFLD